MTLVHHFLRDIARRLPGKTFLLSAGQRYSFGLIDRQSDVLACELQRAGLARGERAAIFMENSAETVVAMFAVLKAGGVFVVLNPTTKPRRLAYILTDCGVRVLIAQASLAKVVTPVRDATPALTRVIWSDTTPESQPGDRTLAQILADPYVAPIDPGLIDQDLCAIIYTSGSTGQPKGVMLTHHNVASTARAIAQYLGNVPDDVVTCVLPLSFGYGQCQITTAALIGFTVQLERSFAYPFDVLKRMTQYRATGLAGVPTIYATMLQMLPAADIDLSRLRYLTNAAARISPAHIRQLVALFPQARFFSMYGQTECLRVCYLDPARLLDKIDSVGQAIPNCETYLLDDAGQRVGPGVIGELIVRGANVMRGYWGKPQETAERLRDGDIPGEKVLHTGDLFRTDEDGFLYFVARKDDVFKCKGEKISPREIEDVLYELDSVREAAIIGVDDPIDGQAIKAFIVARDGCTVTDAQIRQHCRTRLENYMVPKFVEIVTSLPKTDSGKIRKISLRTGALAD